MLKLPGYWNCIPVVTLSTDLTIGTLYYVTGTGNRPRNYVTMYVIIMVLITELPVMESAIPFDLFGCFMAVSSSFSPLGAFVDILRTLITESIRE